MSSPGFQFKQFYVAHDKCAMKVGTDGTLLGAMVTAPIPPFGHPFPKAFAALTKGKGGHADSTNNTAHLYGSCDQLRILDVGTGSGLVALMLAQRFPMATIDAIDIDEGAVRQAQENFASSPWSDRLYAHQAKVQEWGNDNDNANGNDNGNGNNNANEDYLYDLVVSNPPYFQNSLKNPDKGREIARHTDSLSYEELITHSARLLREGGCLWIILPADAENEIRQHSGRSGLHVESVIHIHSKPGKEAKRVILQLSKRDTLADTTLSSPRVQEFYIESENSPRSDEYRELTREFYL